MPKVRSKAKSKTKAVIPRYRGKRPSLFGPPLLLLGEDAAEYDEHHARIRATLNPIDTVYEMFVADVVYLEWEILRWRRQKSSLMRGYQIKALEQFLTEKLKLHYSLYAQDFAVVLASTLQNILPEDQAHTVQQLADACARDERDASDRVEKILNGSNLSIKDVLDPVRQDKAEELAKKYGRREPDVVTLVDEILADASVGIDDLMVEEFVERLEPRTAATRCWARSIGVELSSMKRSDVV